MKTTINMKWAGVAFAAIAFVGLSPVAKAIPLSFENPPIAGTPYNTGNVTIKFSDLDMGTVYPNLAAGTYGNAANVAAGVVALDALTLPANQAVGSRAGSPLGNGLDDSWGIAAMVDIFTPVSATNPVWSPGNKGYELNVVFYGAQDFVTTIDANGDQTTLSVGLHSDVYRNPLGTFDAVKALGGAGRGLTQSQYALISAGTLEFSLLSTAGGLGSNALAEFQGFYSPGFGGTGSAYMNVVQGVGASWQQFDTNSIVKTWGGPNADMTMNFTTRGPLDSANSIPAGSDWLLSSEDPLKGQVIPEPSTVLAGIACALPLLGAGYRRCKKLAARIA